MRRQSLVRSAGDGNPEQHASLSPTLGRWTTPAHIQPRHRSHPVLDRFLSLLATLAIPLQLSSLALATPTLLLTVLEALLETRLIEVENGWRGSREEEDRRRLLLMLLEAITQVWEAIARRTGERGDGWTWRVDEVDVDKAIKGDEIEIARVVEALLCIAEALGAVEGRGGPSTPHDAQLCPRLDPDVFHDPHRSTTSTSLFAPRPLRSRSLVVPSSAEPRRPRASTDAGDPTVAPLSPPSHQTRHKMPDSSTLPHRDSPTSSTSFLATLNDPSSHLVDGWREKRPVPPLSPRRTGSAVAGELPSRSLKEALKRLEAGRREREVVGGASAEGGRQEGVEEEQAEKGRTEPIEGDSDTGERPTTSPARLRPRPPRLSNSRSSSSWSSVSELAKSPLPPCTCSTSPGRSAPATSPPKPSPPRAQRGTTTPAFARARRIRVSRIPFDSCSEDVALLSVHSSTDVERSSRSIGSTLSAPTSDPTLAEPPAPCPQPPRGNSRSPGDRPALSPYTVALTAKRDALKAKLAVLERREADRRALMS
ncbi:hypothetical protein NBRC10512_006138 [Rhodotorula toruloides]|uniref:RHTO0S19e03158g1_1 n=2 Tax=Rhodotorula toruloides TaxID=5286 RepID=A0A061BL69_RHOTO|nr:uncharacterized protein RHTO_03629 [Rhodotorula toruloides NP11]EMS20096.1 hypothetical protein RHTO_03629 [Rhodotorula toruloides NP11]CDR48718.1 RHTO0S19e03158g1_1 [Rhodotorula toruloides]